MAESQPEAKRQRTDDKETFLAVCDELRDFVLSELKPRYEMPDEAVEWIRGMFDYTVKGGKMNRGLTVLHARRSRSEVSSRALPSSVVVGREESDSFREAASAD